MRSGTDDTPAGKSLAYSGTRVRMARGTDAIGED